MFVLSLAFPGALEADVIGSDSQGEAMVSNNPRDPQVYIRYGKYLLNGGDPVKSAMVLEEGRHNASPSSELRLILGRLYRDQDQLSRAEAVAREVLLFEPDNAQAHVLLGEIYFRMDWPQSGLDHFREAHRFDPGSTLAQVRLICGLSEMSLTEEAEDQALRFISLNPDNADLWLALGQVQEKKNQRRAAFKTYGQVLTLAPDCAEAYARQGRLFCEYEQFSAAETACRKALELDPDHTLAHAYLGIACSRLGKGDDARHHARVAEDKGMNMAAVWHEIDR